MTRDSNSSDDDIDSQATEDPKLPDTITPNTTSDLSTENVIKYPWPLIQHAVTEFRHIIYTQEYPDTADVLWEPTQNTVVTLAITETGSGKQVTCTHIPDNHSITREEVATLFIERLRTYLLRLTVFSDDS